MDNPMYEPPRSDLGQPVALEIPAAIDKKIRAGWIAAVVSGTMTLALMVLAVNSDALGGLVDWWNSIDVVLIFALAYGVYRKSRFAAIFLLLYFVMSKLLVMGETGALNGLLVTLIFLYFYVNAVIGTWQYHRLKKAQAASH